RRLPSRQALGADSKPAYHRCRADANLYPCLISASPPGWWPPETRPLGGLDGEISDAQTFTSAAILFRLIRKGREDNRNKCDECQHSNCRMRVFPLPPRRIERRRGNRPESGLNVDRIGECPEDALCRGKREDRCQRPCEGVAIGADQ